jgi:hypothetical protein
MGILRTGAGLLCCVLLLAAAIGAAGVMLSRSRRK